MSGAGGGIAGTGPTGSFFEAPSWIDLSKRPGATVQKAPSWISWLKGVLQLRHIIFSPNAVWLSIALAYYVAFPYDYPRYRVFHFDWVARRTALNVVLVFGYVGFWHAALYVLAWSKRKFVPGSAPSLGRVLHNMWYTFLGTLQWSGWECLFMYIVCPRWKSLRVRSRSRAL